MPNLAEIELEEFLTLLLPYQRKYLEQGLSALTRPEMDLFDKWFAPENNEQVASEDFLLISHAYDLLLARAPAKLRERREKEKRQLKELSRLHLDLTLPKIAKGAPRKDALANEALQLKNKGLSYARVANYLNLEHGEGTTTSEGVRKLIKRVDSRHTADKTQK